MSIKINDYGFSKDILKALEGLGYEMLTGVQEQVIPLALADRDVIVSSQTGSGKTAAFAIPICEKLEIEKRNPQALVLTPTRELAVQLKQDIANIGRFKKVRCAAVFGRQPIETQIRELRQRVHVIVGTPGRIFDHIERENIILEDIKYLVIDEADKMLDMGFIEQLEVIIRKVPVNRVTMVFSATMPEKIRAICKEYMVNPVNVEIVSARPAVETIRQVYFEVDETEKFNLVKKLIYTERPDSCILFCNTRETVDVLFGRMRGAGFLCGTLHGGMEQRDRLNTIQSFKRGEFQFLIATDVAARGIHVEEIALVINYDIPQDDEIYVHRIGRTGRAGNEGAAITLIAHGEIGILTELEQYLGYKITKGEVPNHEVVEKGRLILTSNKAKIKPKSDKTDELNREITRIRINAGKKDKMRPGDILGAITSIAGITAGDIGIIDVQDTCSYVEILSGKGDVVLAALESTKIKGKLHTAKQVGFRSI